MAACPAIFSPAPIHGEKHGCRFCGVTRGKGAGSSDRLAHSTAGGNASDERPYVECDATVATNQTSSRFETYSAPLDKDFEMSVAPWDHHGFATIFSDVADPHRG